MVKIQVSDNIVPQTPQSAPQPHVHCRRFTTQPTKAQYNALIALQHERNSFIQPLTSLRCYEDYRVRLPRLLDEAKFSPTAYAAHGRVPQAYWWVYDDDNHQIVGVAKTRYQLVTGELLTHGGHLDLVVLPECRGQGYGTAALKDLVGYAPDCGLKDILATTESTNLAAQHIIEHVGGQLWGEPLTLPSLPQGVTLYRYWINLRQ